MALVPCARCRQPFYASCHDASCIDALCPLCEFGEESENRPTNAMDTMLNDPRIDANRSQNIPISRLRRL